MLDGSKLHQRTRIFIVIGVVAAFSFGASFLVAPALSMQIYGVASTPELVISYRYFGAGLISVGLVVWPLRNCRDPAVIRPVLAGHAAGDSVGVLVSLSAALSGATNGLVWLNALIYGGLMFGAVYHYVAWTSFRAVAFEARR